MKKIIKQDGDRRVFIYDDGSEVPFGKNSNITIDKNEDNKYNKIIKKSSKKDASIASDEVVSSEEE